MTGPNKCDSGCETGKNEHQNEVTEAEGTALSVTESYNNPN